MNAKRYSFLFSFLLIACFQLRSQSELFIDTTVTAEQMVMDFFDNSCVTSSNVTFNGGAASLAYFEAANTDLGINAGIFICSGDATEASAAVDTFASSHMSAAGDVDLEALVGLPTNDAAVLEFDITVTGDSLDFKYVFGSEEYPEFVGTGFNDVFGFFISGPGNPTPYNIAMIPDTTIPVAINNVNENFNSEYYVPNDQLGGTDIVYDGLTTLLPASFVAVPGETYHVKIAVADVSDAIFDSGVFIGIESLCGDSLLVPPAEFEILAIDEQTVTFANHSRYATSWLWDFGDNTTSTERHPAPHTYAEPGIYTVTLTTENYCCTDTYTFEVDLRVVSTNEVANPYFEVFPNPVEDHLNIRSLNGKKVNYTLFNLSNQVVRQGQVREQAQLNMTDLQPGMYMIMLFDGEHTHAEKILIK